MAQTIKTEHGEMLKSGVDTYEYRSCNIVKVKKQHGGHYDFQQPYHWRITPKNSDVKARFDGYAGTTTLKRACAEIDRGYRRFENGQARNREREKLTPIHTFIRDIEETIPNDLKNYTVSVVYNSVLKAYVYDAIIMGTSDRVKALKDRLPEVAAELEKWGGCGNFYFDDTTISKQ